MNQITILWRKFKGTIRGVDSCSQLSWGVVLGMMIGLLPKDSLLPYCLLIVLLLSKANLLTATLSGLLFSWISPSLDMLTHPIGVWILTFDLFESCWATLMQIPVVAWTRFDNSVVMGSIVLGLMIAYPTYRLSFRFFGAYGEKIFSILKNTRLFRWFIGENKPTLIGG